MPIINDGHMPRINDTYFHLKSSNEFNNDDEFA